MSDILAKPTFHAPRRAAGGGAGAVAAGLLVVCAFALLMPMGEWIDQRGAVFLVATISCVSLIALFGVPGTTRK